MDVTTFRGHSALHIAAWGGNPEIAQLLLEAKADRQLCVRRPKANAFFMAVMQEGPEPGEHQVKLQ